MPLTRARVALCLVAMLTFSQVATAQDWTLIGLGQHQETGRDIYIGGLYLKAGTPRPANLSELAGPWKMEYRIAARRTSIRSLLGGMLLQSEVATGRPPGPATTEFADGILSAIKSSLYAGDAFDIELEGNVTYALLNGQILARSSNPGVASYFLMGWISEQGPASSFRAALLSEQIDPNLLAQHKALDYSAERGAEVATWSAAAAPVEPESPAQQPATPDDTEATGQPGVVWPTVTSAVAQGNEAAPADSIAVDQGEAPGGVVIMSGAAAEPTAGITGGPLAGPEDSAQAIPPADAALQPVDSFALITPEGSEPTETDQVMALGVQEYSQRLAAFQSNMVAKVYSKIRYPKRAVRRNLQGRLELDVVLSGSGELRSVEVVSSSGHDILDNAAVDAAENAFKSGVRDIDPVARAEFGVSPNEMIVPVPVQFRLQ